MINIKPTVTPISYADQAKAKKALRDKQTIHLAPPKRPQSAETKASKQKDNSKIIAQNDTSVHSPRTTALTKNVKIADFISGRISDSAGKIPQRLSRSPRRDLLSPQKELSPSVKSLPVNSPKMHQINLRSINKAPKIPDSMHSGLWAFIFNFLPMKSIMIFRLMNHKLLKSTCIKHMKTIRNRLTLLMNISHN
jgi:hypothetical protein